MSFDLVSSKRRIEKYLNMLQDGGFANYNAARDDIFPILENMSEEDRLRLFKENTLMHSKLMLLSTLTKEESVTEELKELSRASKLLDFEKLFKK